MRNFLFVFLSFLGLTCVSVSSIWADDVAMTQTAATAPTNQQKIWEPPFYTGVAAQVGKILISYDDVRREMAPLSPAIRQQSKSLTEYSQHMEDLYHATLNGLIERALMINEFNAKGYKVPQKEIDNEYNKILKQDFDGHISDLVASLQQQGLTLSAYRKRLEENLMTKALQDKFRHDLPDITPDQIQAYYNANLNKFSQGGSVHLQVITLKSMTDEPADVIQQTAAGLIDQLKNGGDFDKIAKDHNQEGEIDWGWLATSDLSEAVQKTVSQMNKGDISTPVVIDGPKVLIIKLVDRKNEGVASLDDAREAIKKFLFETQATAEYQKWIDLLKKKYFVKINP